MLECKECKKSFVKFLLHISKVHKKFICNGCEQYVSIEKARNDVFCKNSMCNDCFPLEISGKAKSLSPPPSEGILTHLILKEVRLPLEADHLHEGEGIISLV